MRKGGETQVRKISEFPERGEGSSGIPINLNPSRQGPIEGGISLSYSKIELRGSMISLREDEKRKKQSCQKLGLTGGEVKRIQRTSWVEKRRIPL